MLPFRAESTTHLRYADPTMKALVYKVSALRWIVCRAAGLISKRAFYGPLAPLKLVDRAVPELPGPEWVRLRTILGGICGTDLALVAQRVHPGSILNVCARFPAVLGHENVAAIERVGPAASDWQPGQRVCVEPAVGCRARGIDPPCTECAAGRTSLCQHPGDARLPVRAMVGLNPLTGGTWAEYFVAHRSQLFAVPGSVSDDAAVLVDPLASAAHAVLRRPPRPGECVLVNGAGIIALGIIAAIRALGYENRITVIARHPFQAEMARLAAASCCSTAGEARPASSLPAQPSTEPPTASSASRGLDVLLLARGTSMTERFEIIARHLGGKRLTGRFGNQMLVGGFDLTFDCTGTGSGLRDALKWTRSRGTLVAVGTSGITLLETTPIWFDELSILGANGRQIEAAGGRSLHTYSLVLDWLDRARLNLAAFPVTRYRLADYARAFSDLLDRGRSRIVKAAFEP